MTSDTTRRGGQTGSQRPGGGPGRVLAVGFLCALMVAGAIAFALSRDRDSRETPSGTVPSVTVPPITTVVPGTVEGFGVPVADVFGRRVDIPLDPAGVARAQQPQLQRQATDPAWLTAAPAGLCEQRSGRRDCAPGGWQRIHGAVVPMSTSDGPARIDRGIAAGYAHTPQGAALAAAYTTYQVAARPGDRALLAARLLLTPADQQQFDTGIASGRLPVQQDERYTRWMLAFDAFRMDHYSDDFAVVQLAARAPDTSTGPAWSAATVPMVWHDGDWRVRGTGGQLPVEAVSDLAGWTPW